MEDALTAPANAPGHIKFANLQGAAKARWCALFIWLVLKLLYAGGLRIENDLEMRIHNKLPAPFRVRGINMTSNMRMLGSNSLYEVGYQALTGFTAPPFGSSLTTAKYVLNDLRPSMVLALLRDLLAQYGSEKPMLETYTLGHVQLW